MSSQRYFKKQLKRQQKKLAFHVEKLGAAFLKETGLSPNEAVVVTQQMEDGRIVQFYQSRDRDDALSKLIDAAKSVAANPGNEELATALKELEGA